MRHINLFVALSLFSIRLPAQIGNLFINNYPPVAYYSHDYIASTQNWSMFQNDDGVLYISNSERLLQFDGVHWRNIEGSNLTAKAKFSKDSSGKVWIGGGFFSEIGFLDADTKGKVIFKSMRKLLPQPFNETQDFFILSVYSTLHAVYFFSANEIFKWEDGKFSVIKNQFTLNNAFVLNHAAYCYSDSLGLFRFEKDQLKLIATHDHFKNLVVRALLPIPEKENGTDSLLVITANRIYLFDGGNLHELKTTLSNFLSK